MTSGRPQLPRWRDTAASGHADDDLSSARDTYRMWPARFAAFSTLRQPSPAESLGRGLA